MQRSLFAEPVDLSQVNASPEVTLRPYQQAAVDGVFREWESGNVSTLVVIPTGGGKSVVFSEVLRRHLGGCSK